MSNDTTAAGGCTGLFCDPLKIRALSQATSHIISNPNALFARLAAFGLVGASAGFGAVYAWHTGLEHGPLMASIAVLMALSLELAKPLALGAALSALRSFAFIRAPLLALLAVVAIAYSLTAELSLIATMRGDAVAERGAASQAAKDVRSEKERLTTEIAALGHTRPDAAIEADITAKLASDGRLKGCDGRWLASDTARAICGDVAKLRAERAAAERRAQLEAQLDALRPAASATHAETAADPGATALAAYLSALGLTVDAGLVSQLLVLVPVLALEIGSALSALLVQAFPTQIARATNEERDRVELTKEVAQPVVQPDFLGGPDDVAKERERVKEAIVQGLKAAGGELSGGERTIARKLGASRQTMRRAVNALVVAGAVAAIATRNGTVLRLIA